MVGTSLHWVQGPWKGRLALAARPRGDDWLEDEVMQWRAQGIDTVLSLLEKHEEIELGLKAERELVSGAGMNFLSLPIPDRETPSSAAQLEKILAVVGRSLESSRSVVVHCRQGVGRTGLIAACLLIQSGVEAEEAIQTLEAARGIVVPETPQQRAWIGQFADAVSVAR